MIKKTNNNILKQILVVPFASLILGFSGQAFAAQHYQLPGAELGETSNENNSAGRYAHQHAIDIAVTEASSWEARANGQVAWEAVFSSDGATSIELVFGQYHLPSSAQLIIRDEYSSLQRGPFGQEHNFAGTLASPILETSQLRVTLLMDAAERSQLKLRISEANIGFVPLSQFNTKGFGDSGSCHIDSECSDVRDVSDAARATAMITVDGRLCTGVLLNNTSEDGRPLFLTAHHCVPDARQAAKAVLYWNYHRAQCDGGGASLSDSQPGARLLATWELSDFSLLELNQMPPEEYNVHWAGWDARYIEPSQTYSLHHPRGDALKLAIDNDAPLRTYYRSNHPDQGNHLRVIAWDQGSTEAGSSGGGLWNENDRVVGQLHGGRAACGNELSDWYGWLAASWDGIGDCESALKYWLDPEGLLSGEAAEDGRFMDGTDQVSPPEFSYPFCRLTPDDAYEHNDDMEHAYELEEDRLLRNEGGDGIQLDDDWFTFELAEPGKVVIDLLFQHRNGDLDVDLYDQHRQLIEKAESRDNNERLSLELPAGQYFLHIKSAGTDKAGGNTASNNSYNLVWSKAATTNNGSSGDSGGGALDWVWLFALLLISTVRRNKTAIG